MLLAWLLAQKYANHLPLYRQEQIFARDGLRLPRQTLCDWVLAAAEALQPIVDCLMAKIRAGPIMQLDDTGSPWSPSCALPANWAAMTRAADALGQELALT